MSKKELNIAGNVMSGIKNGQIKMKPKWYFILGSVSMFLGLVSVFVISTFLISLLAFSIKTHGPMGNLRFQEILSSFPLWAPAIAIVGIIFGVMMLKKYDFSYKKNFALIVVGIITSIILAGILMDYLNINLFFARRGMGPAMYEKYGGKYGQGQNQEFRMRGGNR